MIKSMDKLTLKGSYVIKTYDSLTGKLLYQSEPIENLIVSSTGGYGRNLVMRQLYGDTTYPLIINSAQIGTGTNVPADTDTGLQTAVLTGISVANRVLSNDTLVLTIFITNAQLANGTYTEFGLFCTGRLFARSIISPSFTKGANQNTVVDYTITLT